MGWRCGYHLLLLFLFILLLLLLLVVVVVLGGGDSSSGGDGGGSDKCSTPAKLVDAGHDNARKARHPAQNKAFREKAGKTFLTELASIIEDASECNPVLEAPHIICNWEGWPPEIRGENYDDDVARRLFEGPLKVLEARNMRPLDSARAASTPVWEPGLLTKELMLRLRSFIEVIDDGCRKWKEEETKRRKAAVDAENSAAERLGDRRAGGRLTQPTLPKVVKYVPVSVAVQALTAAVFSPNGPLQRAPVLGILAQLCTASVVSAAACERQASTNGRVHSHNRYGLGTSAVFVAALPLPAAAATAGCGANSNLRP
jgi:hypothetical protein